MPRLTAFTKSKCASLFTCAVLGFGLNTAFAQEGQPFDRPAPGTENWTTGPAVGETIPEFAGKDQNGIRNEKMVARGGIEPPTRGFSVRCSTN
jgi:hypothetical protein